MGAKTTDMGVSNMSKSVGTIFPITRNILSFMGAKVVRKIQSAKEYNKGFVWKRIISQSRSSLLVVHEMWKQKVNLTKITV